MNISRAFLLALAMVCWFGQVFAQAYPTKPVTIVVPVLPGGAGDIGGRLVAKVLSESLGQSFVVHNLPGAGGILGVEQVGKAAPDGYTLLIANAGPLTVAPLIHKSRGFDPLSRLEPVILIAGQPGVLLVSNSLNVKTLNELLALSRPTPGKVNMASAGNGSLMHLMGEYFQSNTGVKWTHVAYNGSPPALRELVSGRLDVMFDSLLSAAPLVKAGSLRALAVTTRKRSNHLPEVPTLAELGFPDWDISFWQALLAPKGTPPDVILKLNATVNKGLRSAEITEKLAALSASPEGGSPDVLAARMRSELLRWAEAIRISGAAVD